MMWAAGILAALGSITYPAISAFVSIHSTADSQGMNPKKWFKYVLRGRMNFKNGSQGLNDTKSKIFKHIPEV